MQRTSSWVDEIAPHYFRCITLGQTHDQAAEDCKTLFPEILGRIGVSTIQRRMRGYKRDIAEATGQDTTDITVGLIPPGGSSSSPQVPPPLGLSELPPMLSKGIDVPYKDGHVWCDVHIPLHNKELVDLSLERAKVDGVKALYIGGDFMDMQWASKFVSWGRQGPREVRQEFEIAKRIMNAALEVFDQVLLIPGNHDGTRFKYMSQGALGFENLMTMILGSDSWMDDNYLIIGEQRHMVLRDSPEGDWRITHPISVRAVPLSLASAVAWKEGQNVLTGHQHYFAAGVERYGRNLVCDGGYMAEASLMDYKREVDTTHSAWHPGYVELVDGWPHLVRCPKYKRVGS